MQPNLGIPQAHSRSAVRRDVMPITTAQREMRSALLGGFAGQLLAA